MTSSRSLVFKNVEKCAPTGVHDGLGKTMILDHVENRQLLNSNHLIVFSIAFGGLVVKIATLPFDLEMRLCGTFCRFAPSLGALLATCVHPLLTSQGSL